MTSGVTEKFKSTTALLDALRLIATDNDVPDGALKIVAGDIKGAVCFAGGKLTGAYVHTTGERGNDALQKLLALPSLKIKYAEFNQDNLSPGERLALDIKDIISRHTAGHEPEPAAEPVEVACAPQEIKVEVPDLLPEPEPPAAEKDLPEPPAPVNDPEPELKLPENIPEQNDDNLTFDIPSAMVAAAASAGDDNLTLDIPAAAMAAGASASDDNLTFDIPVKIPPGADANATMDVPATSNFVADDTLGFPTDAISKLPDSSLTMDVPSAAALKEGGEPQQSYAEAIHDGQFDAVIHDLSVTKDKEEFARSEGILDHSEEMLSDEQRKMLEELTRNLRDEEAFQETDEQLHIEDDITERRQELLETAPLDALPFDFVEKHLETDMPSLTEDQRRLLATLAAEASDKESFEELDEFLQVKGIHLTPEQLWEYGEILVSRSREEMESEFKSTDERLKIPEDAEFYDFSVPEAPGVDEEELDAIPTPNVIDADRTKYRTMAEQESRKIRYGVGGIIGRARDRLRGPIAYFKQQRYERPEIPIGKIIGMVTITLLCVGIFIIPGMIKARATGQSSEELEREQMRLIVQQEMEESTPNTAHEDTNPKPASGGSSGGGQGGGGGGGGGGGSDEVGSAIENDNMAFAHKLVAEGKLELAARYMETYVAQNPDSISARVSLIQCYIASRHPDKARGLCIATLKRKLTQGEQQTLWNLWRQCQP